MNDDNKWMLPIIEGAGMLGAIVLLGLAAIYYFPILLLIIPLGFIIYGVKHGLVNMLTLLAIAGIILGLVSDMTSTIVIIAMFGPLSAAMTVSIRKRRRPLEVLATGSIVFFVSTLLTFAVFGNASGTSVVKEAEEAFKNALFMQLQMLEGMGLSNLELDNARTMLEDAYSYLILILPAILMVLSFFISYVNYLLSVKLLRTLGIGVLPMPWLHKFTVPNNFGLGMLFVFVGLFIVKKMDPSYYDVIFLNIIVIVGTVFVIQGLAVIDFFLLKLKIKSFVRGILLIVLLILSPMLTLVSIMGGADIILDFRKLRRRKSQ
ncbi:MAG: YybS family protein [Gudongella sp.]|nr:YybS family protein [Gudongella sp.]